MRWLARSELRYAPANVTAFGNAVRLYGGLVLLAAACLLSSPVILVGGAMMSRPRRRRFARGMIFRIFRHHLAIMEKLGAFRVDLSALDALRDAPAMVIAPNHPSMIDAALVLSRLPDVACIMKAEILQNVLFGSGARMAGYITNHPPRSMLRAAADDLRAGCHLLLFPEGTRTRQLPVNELQRTVGVIARRAGVRVQTVIVETNTAFLGKGWPLWRVPMMPMVYRVRLGQRFDVPEDVDAFTAELEDYFHNELAGARLPTLPANSASR
jgi:1-acyl-sn-glycerol-3-phosphate acyltransferase